MNKKFIWIIIGIIVIALFGWYLYQNKYSAQVASDEIDSELSGLDLGDLEKEFADVNADLQNL